MSMRLAKSFILTSILFLAPALQAAEDEDSGRQTTTTITPRLFLFDFSGGDTETHYLERYDYRESFSGDTRSGAYADVDLDILVEEAGRDRFSLERRGFGRHNHRGSAQYDTDLLKLDAGYRHYRSATGGIDFLLSPGQVSGGVVNTFSPRDGTGPFRTFTDDSDRTTFDIDRTSFRLGSRIKPEVLRNIATLSLDYEGYRREGDKFAPVLLDGFNAVRGSGWGPQRWRGIGLDVDEQMDRITLELAATPDPSLNMAYEALIRTVR